MWQHINLIYFFDFVTIQQSSNFDKNQTRQNVSLIGCKAQFLSEANLLNLSEAAVSQKHDCFKNSYVFSYFFLFKTFVNNLMQYKFKVTHHET